VATSIESTLSQLGTTNAETAGRALAPIASAELRGPQRSPVPAPSPVAVDRDALRAAGLLPELPQERHLADQFRAIKRPILHRLMTMTATAKPSEGAQLLLVTSALPGDGKTFTSVNLAMSIARERDVSLLLIDADVVKPHLTRAFGLERQPGLLDALADESIDIETLVRPTEVPGLSLLPVGREQENPTELLSSAHMKTIAGRLSACDTRRLLLFDSAPLLLSNDARAVAQVVRQIVLVVRSGITPKRAVQNAISHVDKEKLTGLVLNQNDMRSFNQYYGYGTYGVNKAL
jgi:protein-tyrosine kinase